MKTPDIEIYIKSPNADQIITWLSQQFNEIKIDLDDSKLKKSQTIHGEVLKEGLAGCIELSITPHAAEPAFTSIWFKSAGTGWQNDEECSVSFVEMFENEVRCSNSGWTEGEDNMNEEWISFKGGKRKRISW